MKNTCNKHSVLSLLLLILLSAAIALSVVGCADDNNSQTGEKAFTVEVYHADGTQKTFEFKTDKETVGDVLLEADLISGTEGEYGLMILTVNGETHDYNEDGKYWAFYVDGEYAMSGVSTTAVTDGAVYAFKVE